MEYGLGKLEEMRRMEYGAANKDELVDIEVEYTYQYMEVIGCESVKSGQVTEEFIHIIVTAYFNGMFEVVRHNMDRAAARRYVKMLNDYHMAGFGTVFDPQP